MSSSTSERGDAGANPVTIADAREGQLVTLEGRICRALPTLLSSALSERPCVYWEVNRAIGEGAPERFDACDFWIEDDSGRALVRAERVRVEARAERKEEMITNIDADLDLVQNRLKELKVLRREAGGNIAAELMSESRELRKLATLLCSIRAHARGSVHRSGGSLAGQERYIREQREHFQSGGKGEKSLKLVDERFEVVLGEGEQIQVTGLCQREAVPAGLGLGGGYRDLPTCLHIRAPHDGQLMVRGVGSAAPRALMKSRGSALASPMRSARLAWIGAAAAAGAALYWLLQLL